MACACTLPTTFHNNNNNNNNTTTTNIDIDSNNTKTNSNNINPPTGDHDRHLRRTRPHSLHASVVLSQDRSIVQFHRLCFLKHI